ncbi:High-affinity glucose transporter RGT2 [Colletotrichum siamense]|uniref:High-affinity glucose transporter RGT2 n=1 Tax=Colletotrichum siamense TaxID=690259 RepID=UPI0018731C9F|nr:High-affinity glucose transporter RGT2 [Colletotrichum siamense]KAF5496988.1 High-affinity glucose transporter RGT2 [Colletotrichum siamense]
MFPLIDINISELNVSATIIGYDSGYLNGVLGSQDSTKIYGIRDGNTGAMYLTPYTRSTFSTLFVVGALVGCQLVPLLTSRIGRRGNLYAASCTYAVGVALQTAGLAPAVFIVGRVLLGVALGLISVTVPAYLMECSTPINRGQLMARYSQFLTTGNVLACAISLGTSKYADSRSWRITIAFQLVLALTVFVGVMFCPESPLLLARKNKIAEARRALAILRNADTNSPEVDEAILDIETHVADQHVNGSARFAECFQDTDLRRTLIGVAMSFFTISTGITFWFGYGTTFFAAAGVDNSYLISLILAITNCVFTAPSMYLIERLGRRRSLIGGGILMGLAQLLTAIIHSAAPDSKADKTMLAVGAVFFIASYAPTWGIGGWLLMAEPFSDRARNYQSSIVLTAYWIITWLVGFVTPYMVDETAGNLGVKVSYIWFGMTVLSLVWAYTCVPELAGLSRSEIDKLFEERVPAWRSREWQRQLRTIQAVEAESDKVPTVEEKMPCKE